MRQAAPEISLPVPGIVACAGWRAQKLIAPASAKVAAVIRVVLAHIMYGLSPRLIAAGIVPP